MDYILYFCLLLDSLDPKDVMANNLSMTSNVLSIKSNKTNQTLNQMSSLSLSQVNTQDVSQSYSQNISQVLKKPVEVDTHNS